MARLLFTAFLAEARGKLNGNVFSRNKGGAIIRNKVTPINPRTASQSLQRAYTSDIAKAWPADLSDDQRKAWESLGQSIGAKSIFGNGLILSGIACFQRINRIVLNAGGTRVDDPPINQDVPSILSATLTANSAGPVLSLAFSPSPLVSPQGLYVFATPAISAGISNVSNRLRFIGFFDGATTPTNILAAWESVFGTFPSAAGQRIAVTAAVVDNTTGAVSAATGASTLVL
jgi:hypothetical protein